jgi:hypothetical protein
MAWIYPDARYYYDWYETPRAGPSTKPTDGSIKAAVVDRLRANPHTADEDLKVDVKRGVVILHGVVGSRVSSPTSRPRRRTEVARARRRSFSRDRVPSSGVEIPRESGRWRTRRVSAVFDRRSDP